MYSCFRQTINYFLIWGHGKKYIYRKSNLPIDRIQKQGLFKKIIQKILYKVFININKKSKFIAPSIPVYKQLLKIGVKKKIISFTKSNATKKFRIEEFE